MPIYEFACGSCGERFEELVGAHVGTGEGDVRCPRCGSAELERVVSSGYAPVHRQLTAGEKRRLEQRRGIDRGGAKQRFREQRAAARKAKRGGGRGG